MDEIFKKLNKHEAVGAYTESEWEKFESTLPKKRKKKIVWLWFVLAFSLLAIPFYMNSNHDEIVKTNVQEPINAITANTTTINTARLSENLVFDDGVQNEQPVETGIQENDQNIQKSEFQLPESKTTKEQQQVKSKNNQTESPQKEKQQQLKQAFRINKLLFSNTNLTLLKQPISNDLNPVLKSIDQTLLNNLFKSHNIPLLHLPKLALIPTNFNIPNPEFMKVKAKLFPEVSNSFLAYGGVRMSRINKLNNSNVSSYSYAIGAFAQINYITNKIIGFNFQFGLQSENNHSLKYSYISDRAVFLESSEKEVKIDVKQLTSANIQLSTLFNWSSKHVTGLGVYYSVLVQSRSNVSVIGTGQFINSSKESEVQNNYHALLSSGDYGLYFSQAYKVKPSWSIAVELFLGANNRLNESYFNNNTIKRREFSLSILKKI